MTNTELLRLQLRVRDAQTQARAGVTGAAARPTSSAARTSPPRPAGARYFNAATGTEHDTPDGIQARDLVVLPTPPAGRS